MRRTEALEILSESYEHVERMGGFPLESAWLAESLYAVGRFDEAERARRWPSMRSTTLGEGRGAGCARTGAGASKGGSRKQKRWRGRPSRTSRGTDYSTDRTWVLMDLAEVLRLAGRPDEAIATIREAIGLFEQREDEVSAAHARVLIEDLTNAGA